MFQIKDSVKISIPIFLFFIFPILLFHQHVFGDATWIGNPDRLNNFLKTLKYYVENQAQGQGEAWNDYELMGYDSHGLPFMFPNILTWITGYISQLIGIKFLYITAGYVSIFLLGLSGITAYLFIKTLTHDSVTSFIGASCYQLSTLTILNMSQNDSALSVLIIMPLLIMAIQRLTPKNTHFSLLAITLLLYLMTDSMTLQTVSYVIIFSWSYVIYRAIKTRNSIFVVVLFFASCITLLASFPRFYTLFCEFQEYTRTISSKTFTALEKIDVYKLRTSPIEILRWFDNAIFGQNPSESIKLNLINLSEGVLIYSSSFIPFLIIYCTIYYKGKFFQIIRDPQFDCAFFFWSFIIALCAVLVKPLFYLIYFLYFTVNFYHSRILLIALLAGCLLASYGLLDLRTRHINNLVIQNKATSNFIALFVAGLLVMIIEIISKTDTSVYQMPGVNILKESVVRIALSASLFISLLFIISSKRVSNATLKYTCFSCLCGAIVAQAFIINYTQINNPENFSPGSNFSIGNFYYAKRDEFLLPDEKTVKLMQNSLNSHTYRTLLVCNPEKVSDMCIGHIPGFWNLRVADGFYGIGLPKRLKMLPWGNAIFFRSIIFTNTDHLPWPVLSLLTVKYIIEVTPDLYKNTPSDKNNPLSVFKDLPYIINPYPVSPRAFFTGSIKPVKDSDAALSYLFQNGTLQDVTKVSAVEGGIVASTYPTTGQVSITGKGDRLDIMIDPSDKERFLVLNDLYFPGWSAMANEKKLRIYPTNVFARGVIVPAFVDKITFQYETLSTPANARWFYLSSLLLLAASFIFLKKRS